MPLTRLQARPRYIIGSMAMFLDRNVKQAYDAEALLTAGQSPDYSTPLTIRRGKPDDLTIVRAAPSIAIDTIAATGGDFYEIGSSSRYRHTNFLFSCFPATTSNGEPCDLAAHLLKAYMIDAFGTYAVKILDYSNNAFSPTNVLFTSDVIEIVKVTAPVDRGSTLALAQERHRFDMHVTTRYPVSESSAT